VTGLKMEQDVIEYKSNMANDGKYQIKKLPGRWKAGECTLTRPLTDDTGFDKWVKDSQLGKMGDARKGGAIIVFDYEGNPVKRYNLTAAWPKSLELSSMKAGDTSVMTEKLVLTYEKCEPA
jgi:phage tail-like protein